MISPVELNYFLEVANSLNLSRASERLGISQPSLSLSMKRLEQSIGVELLIRHKKGVALTQAGKQLLSHTNQLLQYWQEVKSQTLASHQEIQGNYKLGCHPSLGLTYLSGFLPNLLSSYPKLVIDLEYDLSRKITERVINLSIDLALVVNPIPHPELIIHKLMKDDVTFWVANKIKNRNVDLASGEAVIICDPELGQSQWLLKSLQKQGIEIFRLMRNANLEIIGDLTSNGCGVGILPRSIASALYAKTIKPIPNMSVYRDEVCLIYRSENRNIKAIQCIVSRIKNYFDQ